MLSWSKARAELVISATLCAVVCIHILKNIPVLSVLLLESKQFLGIMTWLDSQLKGTVSKMYRNTELESNG